MEQQIFTLEELRCLKAAVDLCLATRDMWDNEYCVSSSPCSLQESDLPTLEVLRLKLQSA